MNTFHQFVAGFRQNDAISNEALVLRDIFRAWGLASDIFCETRHTDPLERGQVRDPAEFIATAGPHDRVLLHASIGTPLNDRFAQLPCRKAILYHNVTPAAYFQRVNPAIAADLAAGRRQIAALAGLDAMALADSAFNAGELTAMGFRNVRVFPLVLDFDRLAGTPDAAMTRRWSDGALNVLFVGRLVPNKRIDHIVRVLYGLRRRLRRRCRFIHAGSYSGTELVYALLVAQARELQLDNVHFLGPVSQAQLNACYHTAGVFLCLSEHEGFCVPLVEAMLHAVPVVALDRAAVAETLDGAGILFQSPDYAPIAETIAMLDEDPAFRHAVLQRQARRLEALQRRAPGAELRALLAPLLT